MGNAIGRNFAALDNAPTREHLDVAVTSIFKRRAIIYTIFFILEVVALVQQGSEALSPSGDGIETALSVLPIVTAAVTGLAVLSLVPLCLAPAQQWKALAAACGFSLRVVLGLATILLLIIALADGTIPTQGQGFWFWISLFFGPVLITLLSGAYAALAFKVRSSIIEWELRDQAGTLPTVIPTASDPYYGAAQAPGMQYPAQQPPSGMPYYPTQQPPSGMQYPVTAAIQMQQQMPPPQV